jgi:hypothetical protein
MLHPLRRGASERVPQQQTIWSELTRELTWACRVTGALHKGGRRTKSLSL